MRVHGQPSLHSRPLYKIVSMRQHSCPREASPVEPLRMHRTVKLKQKSRTESNESGLIGRTQSFVTGLPVQLPSQPSRRTSRERLSSLNRSRPRPSPSQQLILQRAKGLYRDSNMDDAIALFQRLLKADPKPELLFYLGSAFLSKQQHEKARAYLEELLKVAPTYNREMYLLLSIAYKKTKQFSRAKDVLAEGVQRMGDFEEAHQYLGKLHMKMKDFDRAVKSFERCLQLRPESALSLIGLADALRSQGQLQQAICHYSNALVQDKRYQLVCLLKRMTAYYQLHRYAEAQLDADELLLSKVASSEVQYFKGMLLLHKGQSQSASVYFQEALRLNNQKLAVTRSFEELIKLHIKIKDFYQAAFQLSRTSHLNIDRPYLQNMFLFVEGVVDGIKKRYKDSIEKLKRVAESIGSTDYQQNSYSSLLIESVDLYLGYAYFCHQEHKMALQYYNRVPPPHCKTPSFLYNKCLCQGIIHHHDKKYAEAAAKFEEAKNFLNNRVEPYFYRAVNFMQEHYFSLGRAGLSQLALEELRLGETISSNNSLFYFYYAVLLLTRQKPELYLILKAIDKSEDNIAEYYFVKAIIYCQDGNFEEGLADFSNALVVDPNGLDFLKERSKCLYMLGRYQEAVADIKRCIATNANDYEAKLLLCFYLYGMEHDEQALRLILEAMENDTSSSPKIATFVQTLNFRVGNYTRAGIIGVVVLGLSQSKKIPKEALDMIDLHISTKQLMGEFHSGHLLSMRALIHLYDGEHNKCGNCLQRAMTEIKDNLQLDSQNSSIDSESQLRIYQVKFNMILLSLCEKDYDKTETLLRMLIDDTEMTVLIDLLIGMLQLVKESRIEPAQPSRQQSFLLFQGRDNLLSQSFPLVRISLPNGSTLVTRPILFYPERLNFSITPELNEEMLKCFGMDKIEDKPEPPWVTRGQEHIFFTDNVEMRRSVCVSSALDQPEPDRAERLKLDETVEAKLNRIIHGS